MHTSYTILLVAAGAAQASVLDRRALTSAQPGRRALTSAQPGRRAWTSVSDLGRRNGYYPPPGATTTISTITVPTETCSTRCDDYFDDCGNTYGGCWNVCSTSPTWTTPACEATTTTAYVPPITTTEAGPTTISTITLPTGTCVTRCDDYFDDCGNTYGGCWDVCGPSPTWTTPACETTTAYVPPVTTTEAGPTTISTISVSTGTCLTRCDDYIDDCGNAYGGCWDVCGPSPTWTTPVCETTTAYVPPVTTTEAGPTTISTISVPTGTCVTRCDDYFDDCGNTYGGCWDVCGPSPTWTTPECSETSKTGYPPPVTTTEEITTTAYPPPVTTTADGVTTTAYPPPVTTIATITTTYYQPPPNGGDDCAEKCYEEYNECRSGEDANFATCASEYAGCLNYNPFGEDGSLITPTACSPPSVTSTKGYYPPPPDVTTTVTDSPPPPPGGSDYPPPPPSGSDYPPPPPSGGDEQPPPPPSGGDDSPPPPPSGGDESPPPPPSGGDDSPPPPAGGDDSPPPPAGGDVSPPPPPATTTAGGSAGVTDYPTPPVVTAAAAHVIPGALAVLGAALLL